ncbi:hypothetical protein EMIT0111MI5_70167 [Burkholderia sp. IT-111MI5]
MMEFTRPLDPLPLCPIPQARRPGYPDRAPEHPALRPSMWSQYKLSQPASTAHKHHMTTSRRFVTTLAWQQWTEGWLSYIRPHCGLSRIRSFFGNQSQIGLPHDTSAARTSTAYVANTVSGSASSWVR